MLPPPPVRPSPPLTRLLLAVLAILPCLYGRPGQAQVVPDPSVIDVAVFYTPATKTAKNWTTERRAASAIELLVAQTNSAYADSGVNQRINLVAMGEVTGYTETVATGTDSAALIDAMRVDLNRLQDNSDGYMDEVPTIRDRVWADVVMLLRSQDGGLAPVLTSLIFASHAFGVSSANAATFAHELGHLMGLQHDRYEACHHDTDNPRCPPTGYPYAYGYVNQKAFEDGAAASTRWRTIMSYPDQCFFGKFVCERVLYYSNPTNSYPGANGDPMGVALTASNANSTAVDGPADAARALSEGRDTVANFRQGQAVKVTFGARSYSVTEGGTVMVTVELDAAPGRALVIPLTATSTDGAWLGDYTLMPSSLAFGATETEKTVTFSAVNDTRQENQETVTLDFGALPPGVTAGSQATVTLTDDSDTVMGAPSVDALSITSNPGTAYTAGEEIELTVVFTKPVLVTTLATPSIGLLVGTTTRQMTYQAARSASEVLVFTYTVAAGENDPDGVSIAANSLAVTGGLIMSTVDQTATLTHSALAANSRHNVEGSAPVLQTATVDGTLVELTYGEALDESSTPAASAFTVTAGGTTVAVNLVQVAGRTVTLTLGSRLISDDIVTLSYTPGTRPLRDVPGNPAASLSRQMVTNNSPRPIYDTDNDGLIEIATLAQLDAMRHDLYADGLLTDRNAYFAAFSEETPVVCANSDRTCRGYELMADLDFDTDGDGQIDADDDYWNAGAGWEPIGINYAGFEATFEGNDHTISNLFIERRDDVGLVGLFGSVGSLGALYGLGVIDVDITGGNSVGGLVGQSNGSITTSYVTGRVTGGNSVGGLVGQSNGSITTSYVTGRVTGGNSVGGLVGQSNGSITTSYVTGRVTGGNSVGGLVGQSNGSITTSYATGRVTGGSSVGGLVGEKTSGTITASYWDTSTSGQTSGTNGQGKTTTDLQTPTGYTTGSIYANWDVDLDGNGTDDNPWHFGTSSQYPVLKGATTWPEFGYQLRAGPTLTVTTEAGLVKPSWTAVGTNSWTPAPAVTYTIYRTAGSTVTAIAEDLTARAYTDLGVRGGTVYTYQVAAVVNGGEAAWSTPGAVTAPNQAPIFDAGDSTTRTVPENTTGNIGAPVAATDPDDRTLTYSLSGTDATSFTINTSTGQLQTADQVELNYETKSSYEVTVSVRDSKATDGTADTVTDATIAVTITVTDVNEPPTFPAATPTTYSVVENTGERVDIGAPVSATDPEQDTLSYSLRGADAAAFTLVPTTGQLQTKAPLDYESKPIYLVPVAVRDDPDDVRPDATHAVTITVTNMDEPGLVTLSSSAPQEKQALTATLSDPDGSLSGITWQWARSTDQSTWDDIMGATATPYPPQTADIGQYLRATAAYTDGHGMGKGAQAATSPVQAAPQVRLEVSETQLRESGAGNSATVRASLDKASSAATPVRLEVTVGAAAVRLSGSQLTIPAGKTASEGTEVTLTAQDDDVDGPAETKTVEMTGTTLNPLVNGPAAVTLTITDDDTRGVTLLAAGQPIPTAGLSIPEGDPGSYTMKLDSEPTATVTIGVASSETAVSVRPTSLTFTTSTWQTAQTVTVSTEDDTNADDLRATLTHTVQAGSGDYTDVPVAAVPVTVTDDESPSTTVTLRVEPTEIGEGAGAGETVTVTGRLNRAVRQQATVVTVSVGAGTAVPVDDFATVIDFPLTIAANAASGTATFKLAATDDDTHEPAETVTVSGSTADLTVTSATLTITDNDSAPTVKSLAVADDPLREGMTGEVTVTVSNPSSEATVVRLTVTAGAAAVRLHTSELTLPAGETRGTVRLEAVDDTVDGPHREVTVQGRVVSPSPGGRRAAEVRLTVTDDDPPEVRGPATPLYTEHEMGPVAAYTATNPAQVELAWAVEGTDKALFDISGGVLRFKESPDYEASRSNIYRVTVQATDTSSTAGSVPPGTRDVALTVRDVPGTVRLSPSLPRVGRALTATMNDPDGVEEVTEWCWERSIYADFPIGNTIEVARTATPNNSTATYTPVADDLGHYLRATVSYTDGDGTSKAAAGTAAAAVSVRPPPPPPPPRGSRDQHGNTAAQATQVRLGRTAPWTASISGQINTTRDRDYFTFSLPQAGVLVVETTGSTDTVGAVWQDGVELASMDTGGERQNFRLRVPVQAGPVVIAVAGNGRRTGSYTLETRLLVGYLENPGRDSFQSGIGLLSGWVCDAETVEIEIETEQGAVLEQAAAYGTERLDTEPVCGDTDNGFGLLFNWNLLGDGEHDVVAFVDGVELSRTTVRVTTLGAEFLRDVAGRCEVADFPMAGETARLTWQQTSQNFVTASERAPSGERRPGAIDVGYLENPGPNSFQSGIGVISGWVCEGDEVMIALNGAPQPAAYGTERLDTREVCGDVDNGFGLLFNWNLLGDGEHTVVAWVDAVELGRATVRVTTLGHEFLRGAEGECTVEDFPAMGQAVTLEWQQTSQNFVITDVE